MKILYKLDYSEPLSIDNGLLGSIKLVGDTGTEINEKYTFIESWLVALCEGFQNSNIKNENQCIVEIPEEPDPLIFIKADHIIKYGEQFVIVKSFSREETVLHKTVKEFLSKIKAKNQGGLITILRNFVSE